MYSLEDECQNIGYVKDVIHLTIKNGEGDINPLFYCGDARISQADTIQRSITSPDNTLVFNLTAGEPPADKDPWYDIHYKGE